MAKSIKKQNNWAIILFFINIGVYLQCERGEGTDSPLIFVE